MKWGTALIAFAIYSSYAFACHWISCHLLGHSILWFCLCTGLLAANEHYIAWNFARLPEKVSMLAGIPLIPTMIFAFFEYQVYWAISVWIAWILLKLSAVRRGISLLTHS